MKANNHYDVIVLGAGAAGLMCALTAGQGGLRVLVLEKSNKPGKKILMSGGGRCNFTNLYTSPDNFLSHNPHFCKSALSRFTPWHFIELVEKHEIPYHEKELGQLFCDRSSKDILNMLLDECAAGEVIIRLNTQVDEITYGPIKTIQTTEHSFTADNLVVATGGLSIPKMGGSDYGYRLAEQLALSVLPKQAALVPFVFTDQFKDLFARLSGTAVAVEVSIPDHKQAPRFSHQMLFTHRGLSGPSMLQISSYWQQGQSIAINLMPNKNACEMLMAAKSDQPNITLEHWLATQMPNKVAGELLAKIYPQWQELKLQNITNANMQQLGIWLNDWRLKPSGTEGYRTAEVTLGGVDTAELSSKTMACLKYPCLYFIGEVVDVTGHLGGFNFQWAWASGYVAGRSLLDK